MSKSKSKVLSLLIMPALLSGTSAIIGQTPTAKKRATQDSVIVERQTAAPQVITVIHRINGLKMVRLLMRSGEGLRAVDSMDEAFAMTGQVHTNIIAGLSLDDGQTVAVWLPEAEVEIETTVAAPTVGTEVAIPQSGPMAMAVRRAGTKAQGLLGRPDISIIERDGKRLEAQYVGLDGPTGLSVLRLSTPTARGPMNVADAKVSPGQRLRLFSPEPVRESTNPGGDSIYVRIGETEGLVGDIVRDLAGEIRRIKIQSLKLSPSKVGAIAVNDAGQTVGIVESVANGEANVLTLAIIRAAAKRVLEHQASVPRPWLGVTGESVAFASLDRIVGQGWETSRARSLLERRRGILLNAVAPGSPAALAELHAGDVIVSVNNTDVKTTEEFSMLLNEPAGTPIRFEFVRPKTDIAQQVIIKLSEARGPFFTIQKFFPAPAGDQNLFTGSLLDHGIESVPLSSSPGATTLRAHGLLVVQVQPSSAAFAAGLRPGDVIEAIDEQKISSLSSEGKLNLTTSRYVLRVLRGKERLVIQVSEKK